MTADGTSTFTGLAHVQAKPALALDTRFDSEAIFLTPLRNDRIGSRQFEDYWPLVGRARA